MKSSHRPDRLAAGGDDDQVDIRGRYAGVRQGAAGRPEREVRRGLSGRGDPVNVLVMRKGSVAELSGGFDASLFPTLKTLPGIAARAVFEVMTATRVVLSLLAL